MNQPIVAEPVSPNRVGHAIKRDVAACVIGMLTVIVLAFVMTHTGVPPTIPRITFENPTRYALNIEVSPGTGSGWIDAGFVPREASADVSEIIDQGDVWLFRFQGQGESGGELQVTRADLQRTGWRVEIPPEVGWRLAAAGAPVTEWATG